jgi:hypothetical protein
MTAKYRAEYRGQKRVENGLDVLQRVTGGGGDLRYAPPAIASRTTSVPRKS